METNDYRKIYKNLDIYKFGESCGIKKEDVYEALSKLTKEQENTFNIYTFFGNLGVPKSKIFEEAIKQDINNSEENNQIIKNSTGPGREIPISNIKDNNKAKKKNNINKRKAEFLLTIFLGSGLGVAVGGLVSKANNKFAEYQSTFIQTLINTGAATPKHELPEGSLISTDDVTLTGEYHKTGINLDDETANYVALNTIEEMGGNTYDFAYQNVEVSDQTQPINMDITTEEEIQKESGRIEQEKSLEASRKLEAYRNSCHHAFLIKLGLLGDNINDFAKQIGSSYVETSQNKGRGR